MLLREAERFVDQVRAGGILPWEALYAEAATEMSLAWKGKAAGDAFRRANALNPQMAPYGPWHFLYLITQRKFEEALELSYNAVENAGGSPAGGAPEMFAHRAMIQALSGQSIETTQSLVTSEKLVPSLNVSIAWALAAEACGSRRTALEFLEQATPVGSEPSRMVLALTACCSGFRGQRQRARAAYDRIVTSDAKLCLKGEASYTSSFHLAIAALGLDEPELSLDWLVKSATVDRKPLSLVMNTFPPLRHLYENRRFRLLVDQMGLELPAGAPAWK